MRLISKADEKEIDLMKLERDSLMTENIQLNNLISMLKTEKFNEKMRSNSLKYQVEDLKKERHILISKLGGLTKANKDLKDKIKLMKMKEGKENE